MLKLGIACHKNRDPKTLNDLPMFFFIIRKCGSAVCVHVAMPRTFGINNKNYSSGVDACVRRSKLCILRYIRCDAVQCKSRRSSAHSFWFILYIRFGAVSQSFRYQLLHRNFQTRRSNIELWGNMLNPMMMVACILISAPKKKYCCAENVERQKFSHSITGARIISVFGIWFD